MRNTWSWTTFLLLWVTALGAQGEPPTVQCPERPRDSKEPWGAFLGKAAHFVIAEEYRKTHLDNNVYLNNVCLGRIVEDGKLGDPERLPAFTSTLCPDITDADARVLFEIKPDDEEGLQKGREQAARYLAALNAVVDKDKPFVGGTGLAGSLFVEFRGGQSWWELSWRTPEPGVTLYRWVSRERKPDAPAKQLPVGKVSELRKEEAEKLAPRVEQAIVAAYAGQPLPQGLQVYRPVDCRP